MNVFETIKTYGHDDDFEPTESSEPTKAMPGTEEKIEVLRQRVENGQEVFSERDVDDYDDSIGTVRPSGNRSGLVNGGGKGQRVAKRDVPQVVLANLDCVFRIDDD